MHFFSVLNRACLYFWVFVDVFTTFSRAVSRCMGAAMICLAWMTSAVLYWVVSHFLSRPVEQKCYSVEQENLLRPLFKAIVYSWSWVKNSVNERHPTITGNCITVYIDILQVNVRWNKVWLYLHTSVSLIVSMTKAQPWTPFTQVDVKSPYDTMELVTAVYVQSMV